MVAIPQHPMFCYRGGGGGHCLQKTGPSPARLTASGEGAPTAREQAPSRRAPRRLRPKEAAMLVSDVLRVKGHNVVKIHATDSVELAVRRLAEHGLRRR